VNNANSIPYGSYDRMDKEKTLLIIKPDAVRRHLIGEILRFVEKEGFVILGLKMLRISKERAYKLYEVHKGKHFYEDLVNFISGGPIVVALLEAENAVARLRNVIGETNPQKAAPETIRGKFGNSLRENAVHAPDSKESATQEIALFFG